MQRYLSVSNSDACFILKAMQGGSIGIVIAMKWYEPLTNTTEDILAARRALSFELEWFLDPIFFGDHPRAMREILNSNLPTFTSEEKKLLLQYKTDFIGLNHYTAIYAKDCIYSPCNLKTYEGNALVLAIGERNGVKIGRDTALDGYYVVPEAMEPAIMYVNQRYKDTPVFITENGYSQWSDASREELINDVERVNYLQGYVTYISAAIRNGANVRGYFVWTLLDNFEWTFGFSVRYGLYHVHFDTLERTPRIVGCLQSGIKASSQGPT
uniref:BGL04 n=1 Tax=Arundo donax TaxID=35708 RepID=A0A0A9EPA4_ARUDO